MGSIGEQLLVALVPLAILQTGALIFFAGSVVRTLKDHDKAISEREEQCEKCNRLVAVLAQKSLGVMPGQ